MSLLRTLTTAIPFMGLMLLVIKIICESYERITDNLANITMLELKVSDAQSDNN